MPTLGLIPARGGSKGIPRKNVLPIAGKPLIGWTIEAALGTSALAAVVVSTDDAEIAAVAREYGAQVPFMRPSELARDDTPGVAPVLHALDVLAVYDAVVLLQPTSPLRTAADVSAVLALSTSGARSIVSVSEVRKHPDWMFRLDHHDRLERLAPSTPATRRQEQAVLYGLNGAIYYATTSFVRANAGFIDAETIAYIMPEERAIDIDVPLDWRVAELLLKERG